MSTLNRADQPIVVEQGYPVEISRVWRAITDPDQMSQWYFPSITDFEAKVGFETEFMVENEGRRFPHTWKVTQVIPEQKLVYDFNWRGYEGRTFVTFDLQEAGQNTLMRVTHIVTEDLKDDIPEFSREACEGGWKYFLQDSLKRFLAQS